MTKTVWITGASSGIGREFARRYAAMGCRLILTARRADRLTALAEELNDVHGTVCRILPADLADRADCDRLCAELAGERIDIFINNAGFGVCGSLLETDPAKEEEMVQVNVAAMRRLFQFMLRRMQAQGGGTILNVASSAGLLPGGLLCQQGLCGQPDPGRGPGAAGKAQPGVRLCPLSGAGEHRVQRPGRGGVRAQGHHAGVLRGRGHPRHAAP